MKTQQVLDPIMLRAKLKRFQDFTQAQREGAMKQLNNLCVQGMEYFASFCADVDDDNFFIHCNTQHGNCSLCRHAFQDYLTTLPE